MTPEQARKAKDSRLKRVYGITADQWDGMAVSQGMICGFPTCSRKIEPGKRFSVDHDHKTGEVRAILCMSCNAYLVRSYDAATAWALYSYLTAPPARQYFGYVHFVPKGMEKGQKRKRRSTRKRDPRGRGK